MLLTCLHAPNDENPHIEFGVVRQGGERPIPNYNEMIMNYNDPQQTRMNYNDNPIPLPGTSVAPFLHRRIATEDRRRFSKRHLLVSATAMIVLSMEL